MYREFRRRLAVPLLTVELSFGGEFHLQPEEADILIRRRGGSVLWQKERLLNLALRALPAHVEAVAWLDCDVVFLREDWPEALLQRLQDFEMVQPFRRFHYQNRGECLEDFPISLDGAFESAAFRFTQGRFPQEAYQTVGLSRKLRYMPGAAWAARRELLEAHGFYDTAVLGGGDKLMFSAAAGRYDRIGRWMSLAHQSHFSDWAMPFADSVKRRIYRRRSHPPLAWGRGRPTLLRAERGVRGVPVRSPAGPGAYAGRCLALEQRQTGDAGVCARAVVAARAAGHFLSPL